MFIVFVCVCGGGGGGCPYYPIPRSEATLNTSTLRHFMVFIEAIYVTVFNVPLLPLFHSVCLKRQNRKLPMLLLLPLFQAVLWEQIKENTKFLMLPLLPLFQGVCWKRKKHKLPMLLILPLFQGICGNKKRGKPKFPMLPVLPLFQGVC